MAEPVQAPSQREMLEALSGYVRGSTPLDDFRRCFVPWSVDLPESDAATDFAHHIDGILGEASSGEWSEADLRKELADAVRSFELPNGTVVHAVEAADLIEH